jgi:hypothetical protein
MVRERNKMEYTLVGSPPAGTSMTHPADMPAAVLTATATKLAYVFLLNSRAESRVRGSDILLITKGRSSQRRTEEKGYILSFSTTGIALTKATRAVLARARRIVEDFMFACVL